MSSDKVILTGDGYSQIGTNSYKFQGSEFIVLDKNALVSGASQVAGTLFPPNQGDVAIEPAQQINSTTNTLYMAAVNSGLASTSTLDVWTVTGSPATGSVQAQVTALPIGPLSIPPNAQQAGTSVLLDTVYRQGSGSLWVSANDACKPPGDSTVRSCLRFIEISIGSTISVAQDF